MTRAARLLAAPVVAIIALFLAPLLLMAQRSLVDASGSFTLDHYWRFISDPYYLGSLVITIGTALLVTAITLIAAFPVAYAYWQASTRVKPLLAILLLSPFYANVVVKVFGWMVLLPGGWIDSYAGLLIISVHRALPFMVLLLAASMERIEPEWIESARTCGARGSRVLRTIVLPLSRPGAVAGSTLVFSLTTAAYVVPALAGGTRRGQFLPVQMYQQITISQDWSFGAAIGVILLVTSSLTIAAGQHVARERAGA
jgi:putative spermidine/putrescine transport system permease protein